MASVRCPRLPHLFNEAVMPSVVAVQICLDSKLLLRSASDKERVGSEIVEQLERMRTSLTAKQVTNLEWRSKTFALEDYMRVIKRRHPELDLRVWFCLLDSDCIVI